MACSILVFSIIQNIMNILGFLHFWGSFICKIAETFSLPIIFSCPISFLLLVHNSFKNLAYRKDLFGSTNHWDVHLHFPKSFQNLFLLLFLFAYVQFARKGWSKMLNKSSNWRLRIYLKGRLNFSLFLHFVLLTWIWCIILWEFHFLPTLK